MHLTRLQIVDHQTRALEDTTVPTVQEGHITTVRRELSMGDEVILVGHVSLRLQRRQRLQVDQ